MIRRVLAAGALALVLSVTVSTPVAALGGATGGTPVVQDDDIPDQCRTIIGCPDAGPKPENPGDRGGYAQFLTLGALAAGVGFILFRIGRAVRTGPSTQGG